ncbi:unnamed protein product [Cercospora beticola]|nr:unnamed protein product [Cercospora beticola]
MVHDVQKAQVDLQSHGRACRSWHLQSRTRPKMSTTGSTSHAMTITLGRPAVLNKYAFSIIKYNRQCAQAGVTTKRSYNSAEEVAHAKGYKPSVPHLLTWTKHLGQAQKL